MQGKIIKGIGGFYYIHTPGMGVYECKAKGIFRNQRVKPLVGDNVSIDILDEKEKKGNIMEICNRKNQLIRPAVSNVDQAMVIFAAAKPAPNLNLLDRFLISMKKEDIETIVCFNKMDIVTEKEIFRLRDIYHLGGYHVLFTSACMDEGVTVMTEQLQGKTTVLAGPSGVGKSSLINRIKPEANMETGEISARIERGKHTTRHSELFLLNEDTYIMDTPGFSSLHIEDIEKENLKNFFPEFAVYEEGCRFRGCIHINEPGCRVKEALNQGGISKIRYDNYVSLYNEIKDKRKY